MELQIYSEQNSRAEILFGQLTKLTRYFMFAGNFLEQKYRSFFQQDTNSLEKIDQMVKEEVVFAHALSKTYFSLK